MWFIDLLVVSFVFSFVLGIITFFIEGFIEDALWVWLGGGVFITIIGLVVLGVNAYLLARGY